MITLITGAPGSGKTLYCVSKLISKIAGTTVDGTDDDGNKVTYPRTIYSNVNRLLIEHEMVDEPWLEKWFDNIKPGAFIVYDEIQKPWPNRPIGSKVPDYIQRLETHRHQGCDFVLMTQNPQLIDPNVRKLIGRHLHIRRVGNMGAAIVYEWDTCSNSLNFKNSFTKSPWKFDKKAQTLYKSAEVHTKVPRRVPTVMFAAVLAMAAAAYMWPTLIARIAAPLQGKSAIAKPVEKAEKPPIGDLFAPGGDLALPKPAQEPLKPFHAGLPLAAPVEAPPDVVAGCVQAKTACVCFTSTGVKVDKPADFCEATTGPGPVRLGLVQSRGDLEGGFDVTSPRASSADSAGLMQWVYRDRTTRIPVTF